MDRATIPIRALALLTCALLSGCAWQQQERLASFDAAYRQGDYHQAASLALRYGTIEPEFGASGELLWTLQAASALQAQGRHRESVRLFDTTEVFFRIYDERAGYLRWAGQVGATLTNDSTLPYEGRVHDAIMVNSYKALNFMAMGDWDLARVELNRARDRQRRAANTFAGELAEARREWRDQTPSKVGLQDASSRTGALIRERLQRLEAWSIYPRFINPLATWLDGFFRLTRPSSPGDYNRAADALGQTLGMVSDNPAVRSDWEWAEALADGRKRPGELPATVWVLYEDGLAPRLEEERISLPFILFLRNQSVLWTGLAYPSLDHREAAVARPRASLGARQQPLQILSSLDAVISTEFAARFPGIITRALVSAAAKTYIQYELGRQLGPLAGLLGVIYQAASTRADTRSWTSLPKTVELAKLQREGADQLTLDLGRTETVQLPESHWTLVWVRKPAPGAEPAIHVIAIGRR